MRKRSSATLVSPTRCTDESYGLLITDGEI